MSAPQCSRGKRRGAHDALERERHLAVGRTLEPLGHPRVEPHAQAERAQHVGAFEPDRDGHRRDLQEPRLGRQQLDDFLPLERTRHGRRRRRSRTGGHCRQHTAAAIRDHEQVNRGLALILRGDGRDRLGVPCFDGPFEPRQVRHQPRRQQRLRRQGAPLLIDQVAGIRQSARQLDLRLARGTKADDIDGHARGDDGQQRRGDEDAVGERGEQRHRSGKSSSTPRDSRGHLHAARVRDRSSTHATSVDVPGGTWSIW